MSVKAIFLDKDGTLIENVPYNIDPKLIRLTPKACEGLKIMQKNGFKIFVFSNQSGLARGYFTLSDLKKAIKTIKNLLVSDGITVDGFYFCPHLKTGLIKKYAKDCSCRKPKIGMIEKAQRDFNLDLENSWVIGDILSDIEAGNRAGCRSILLDNGSETKWLAGQFRTPDYKARDLLDAADFIVKEAKNEFFKNFK